MALGKSGQQYNGKAYSLKLKMKNGDQFLDCAEFDVQEKNAEGKYVSANPPVRTKDVTGDLFSIRTRLGEHDGHPIRNFTLGLRDRSANEGQGEAYFVDVSLGSGLGRGLANSVLNLKAFTDVSIGLYGQLNKQTKKTYPAVSLRQGTGKDVPTVKWAYDPAKGELPLPREFEGKGGKVEKDYTKQEVFLFEKLTEFGAQFDRAGEPASTSTTTPPPVAKTEAPKSAPTSATKASKPAPVEQDDINSVPF